MPAVGRSTSGGSASGRCSTRSTRRTRGSSRHGSRTTRRCGSRSLWTKAREEKWRADLEKRSEGADKLHTYPAWKNTASRPSNVMIWRPEHLGLFLDHAVDDRLYALFCVTAFRGLRRGETVGLK